MAKDINIHLKTTGAARTKQQLRETGEAAKGVGEKTAAGHKQGAQATEQATQKMTGMGRVLNNLKSQVFAFVGAWLGMQAVQRALSYIITRLEKIQQLQKDIYQESVDLAEIGQALEFQTGTRGKQQWWTEQAIKLQQAGALATPETAQQMMVSMDIAFERLGGIQSEQVMELAMQLAPFVGAAGAKGLGPEEVSKLFEFAGIAGIAPTEEAYKEYFAKLQAGYTASKAVDFGQFMMGLQKGGTAYMAMGGTLEEAISAFAGARAVMANEALAATLVEQIARLSGGAYERPRQAIERKLDVSWPELSMDERMYALLRYVGGIPEARRGEVLAKEGFPIELTTQIGKMVSPEAMRTMAATRERVAEATATMIEELTQAYLDSMLAQQRQTEAGIGQRAAEEGPVFAEWQIRLQSAQKEVEILAAKGQARAALHPYAAYIEALEQLQKDVSEFRQTLTDEIFQQKAQKLEDDIKFAIARLTEDPLWAKLTILGPRAGLKYTERFTELLEQSLQSSIKQAEQELPTPAEEPTKAEMISQIQELEETIAFDNERIKKLEEEAAQLQTTEVRRKEIQQSIEVWRSQREGCLHNIKFYRSKLSVLNETEPAIIAPIEPVSKAEVLEPISLGEVHHHHTTVVHNYDSSMRFYPRLGDDERGPRFEQV